jgi:hypothetical protein
LEQKRIEKIEAYPKRSVEIYSIPLCPTDCGRLPVSISDFGLHRGFGRAGGSIAAADDLEHWAEFPAADTESLPALP